MPQVDRATHAFADRGVELIAVNLQESPAKINGPARAAEVVPHRRPRQDGRQSPSKYGATAIPQTVVIDREGKIARLFIGGGPHLGDQLQEALQALMPAKQP